ncbi:hypothetical protein E2562_016337 [Oryza meyeriana var. granulata]|uniref:Uncharacterized protein n=1 Tax=Oryza meyeriana var. granulata TaxID=110450 RepID=A0A6G1DX48_9ORYZ|nr:hypothetical protein E2562_016337 [Oryza meyeriana var. granulata]
MDGSIHGGSHAACCSCSLDATTTSNIMKVSSSSEMRGTGSLPGHHIHAGLAAGHCMQQC